MNDQPIIQVEDDQANDSPQETDLQKVSAEQYGQRGKNRIELHKDDWWIAIAVYSILVSVAFLVS